MSLLSEPLRAFMAIVKHKTVHAAAAHIHLTQTAVTQRIRMLEKKLRTTLFIRTRRGMLLTQEGEALLRYCLTAKELEGETLASIQGAGTTTNIQLTISAPTSITHARIIPQCISVMKKFPHLLIRFDVNDVENRHHLLRSGECDFAIMQTEDVAQEMQHKQLKPEQYVLVCPSRWRGRKLADIIQNEKIIDFDPTDHITINYLKHFKLFDAANHARHFVNRIEDLALLVKEGLGYTALTKEFSETLIRDKELILLNHGKIFNYYPVLAWYHRPEPPAYFSAIVEAIK